MAAIEAEGLTAVQVGQLIGVSARAIYNIARLPDFPVSIRVGRARRWLKTEILAWMSNRAERDEPPSRRRTDVARTSGGCCS